MPWRVRAASAVPRRADRRSQLNDSSRSRVVYILQSALPSQHTVGVYYGQGPSLSNVCLNRSGAHSRPVRARRVDSSHRGLDTAGRAEMADCGTKVDIVHVYSRHARDCRRQITRRMDSSACSRGV